MSNEVAMAFAEAAFIWTTKDGRELKLEDMATGHIVNCIRMLYRWYVQASNMTLKHHIEQATIIFKAELERRGTPYREALDVS